METIRLNCLAACFTNLCLLNFVPEKTTLKSRPDPTCVPSIQTCHAPGVPGKAADVFCGLMYKLGTCRTALGDHFFGIVKFSGVSKLRIHTFGNFGYLPWEPTVPSFLGVIAHTLGFKTFVFHGFLGVQRYGVCKRSTVFFFFFSW